MAFIFSGVFWGLVLILIGLSVIIKIIFHIDIPVFQIIIGSFLIYLGLQIIFGSSFFLTKRISRRMDRVSGRVTGQGGHRYYHSKDDNEYSMVFSSGNIDLSSLKELSEDKKITVSVVFGSAVVWIDPEVPVNIRTSTVFGETVLPDKTVSFFGDDYSRSGDAKGNVLHLEINTVFGSTEVKRKE